MDNSPDSPTQSAVCFSLGILAWNEEKSIGKVLDSLFQQSVFQRLAARGERCEIVLVANGCTDGTVSVAKAKFDLMRAEHPYAQVINARVLNIEEPGRNKAWNRFVHEDSARDSKFIFSMDADIIFKHRDTLYNMFATLEDQPYAIASSDVQYKDIVFKENKSLFDRLSLATSNMTNTSGGRLCGQLYCLRTSAARQLYRPRDLGANDDGFFKAVLATNFFEHELDNRRIALARDAGHVFEAYVSPRDIMKNQMRQMIGQTTVYVLVEYLKSLPAAERKNLAVHLRRREGEDPEWLRKLLAAHISKARFSWQLFPGILSFRFRRLAILKGLRKITHAPAAVAGFFVTLLACHQAHKFMKKGQLYYWPKASRDTILNAQRA